MRQLCGKYKWHFWDYSERFNGSRIRFKSPTVCVSVFGAMFYFCHRTSVDWFQYFLSDNVRLLNDKKWSFGFVFGETGKKLWFFSKRRKTNEIYCWTSQQPLQASSWKSNQLWSLRWTFINGIGQQISVKIANKTPFLESRCSSQFDVVLMRWQNYDICHTGDSSVLASNGQINVISNLIPK